MIRKEKPQNANDNKPDNTEPTEEQLLREELERKFDELFGPITYDDDDEDDEDPDEGNFIVLNDENGDEITFEFLDLIEYKGKEYVVLLPVDDPEDDCQVVILQLDENADEDEEAYVSVDDDRILNAVFRIFKENNEDKFDFTD